MNLKILLGAVELGLIFGVMALGVYLTFRILDFPDLTVDGSLTIGAATAAVLIIQGYSPWLGLALAFLAGGVAGMITGVLHTHFRIIPILAGILTMTGLYSVNLRIMGRANLPLLGTDTVVDSLRSLGIPAQYGWVVFGLLLAGAVIIFLYWLFQTELGLALRATGDNEVMIKSLGVNVNGMKILGLSLGNALVALAGGAVAQLQGFADISMGIGMIIAGLAAVIIGEMLIGTRTLLRALIAVLCGSLVYRIIIAVVLRLGLQTTDLKLVTAVLVVLALTLPRFGFKKQLLALGGWSRASVEKGN
ncbi:MAG: ABC transporter permease [Clostridia bacterium]|nr:ABC transporter permease [Clostridia bacterium]